jgi:multiple sugar transport system permease protein
MKPGGRGLGYAFVVPTLAFLVLFNVYPLLYNIILSFTDAHLSGGDWRWVGAANYDRVFSTDPRHADFGSALRTTSLFVVVAVSIELLLGFLLALALHRRFAGKGAVMTLVLVPMMLSPAVMGLYWSLILNSDYGILDQAAGALAAPQPRWLVDPAWKFTSLVLVDVWMWTPFMMLISLAGLGSIPKHLYEAAEIDRASAWMVFRRITLPLCAPLLVLAALLRATDALKQFDLVMAMSGPNESATQTVSALLYQLVFQRGKVGLGSAYACVVLVVAIALATVCTRYLDGLARRQGRPA